MSKLFRLTTIPLSLKVLLKGQLRYMSQSGFDVTGVSSKGKELRDVHNDEGISVVEIEMTRVISPLKDVISLWRFYRLCKKEKPLIVHSHTPKAGIVGMLGANLAKVPIRLHTVAGLPLLESTGLKRKVLDFVEKMTFKHASVVYPNSYGLYDYLVKKGYTSKEKMKVISNGSSNGIDTEHFSTISVSEEKKVLLKKKLGIEYNDFVFMFVGRIVRDKGINELIEAFTLVNEYNTHLSCKLLLVGPLEQNLNPISPQTLKEIDINNNIILTGFQDDVRPFYSISNALVFPSYREGFPNVVMQAGAMGLPSIVTDINGCNEIIIQNINGLIIPPKDKDAILEAMKYFLYNPAEIKRMAENSRQLIIERYEQQKVWNALLDEYRSLLKKHDLFQINNSGID